MSSHHHPSDAPSLQRTLVNTNTTRFLLIRIPKLAIQAVFPAVLSCDEHSSYITDSDVPSLQRTLIDTKRHHNSRFASIVVAYEHSMAQYRAMRNLYVEIASNLIPAAFAASTNVGGISQTL